MKKKRTIVDTWRVIDWTWCVNRFALSCVSHTIRRSIYFSIMFISNCLLNSNVIELTHLNENNFKRFLVKFWCSNLKSNFWFLFILFICSSSLWFCILNQWCGWTWANCCLRSYLYWDNQSRWSRLSKWFGSILSGITNNRSSISY